MRSLKRLARLSGEERAILPEAALSMILIRLALSWLSLPTLQKIVFRAVRHSETACAADRIAWAIRVASRFLPGSTCLAQALVAQILLVRYGYDSCVMIGVTKNEYALLEAHAWVVCEEQIMIGGPGTQRYTSLLTLGSLS